MDEPSSPVKTRWQRLESAVRASYAAMRPHRQLRRNLVTEYAGPGYTGSKRQKYLYKLAEAIDAYTTLLVGGEPQAQLDAIPRELDSFAFVWQHALNRNAIEIQLRKKIERWVTDACYLVGIMRLHMADSGRRQELGGVYFDPGRATVSNISLDDFVLDMTAKSFETARYMGDKYRVPLSQFEDEVAQGMYDERVAALVTPSKEFDRGDDRVSSIVRGATQEPEDIEPMVDLCDFWLDDNTIVTFWLQDHSTFSFHPEPLAEMPWLDNEQNPYPCLGFREIPEMPLYSSPASQLVEIELLITSIANLVARQARRQKLLITYERGSDKDATSIRKSPDGAIVGLDSIDRIGSFNVPGVDPQTMSLLLNLLGFFDTQAGNLTALMGLGAQTGTVGQETLIHQAGNRKIAKMAERVVEGTSRVFRGLAVLMWHDQFQEMALRLPIPGAEEYVATLNWNGNERAGNLWDYNIKCNAVSLQYEPPEAELALLKSLIGEIYGPLMQVLMAQGGQIDMVALTERIAKILNKPWLVDLVMFSGGEQLDRPEASVDVKKPSTSARHYFRHDVSEAAQQNPYMQQAQEIGGGGAPASPAGMAMIGGPRG